MFTIKENRESVVIIRNTWFVYLKFLLTAGFFLFMAIAYATDRTYPIGFLVAFITGFFLLFSFRQFFKRRSNEVDKLYINWQDNTLSYMPKSGNLVSHTFEKLSVSMFPYYIWSGGEHSHKNYYNSLFFTYQEPNETKRLILCNDASPYESIKLIYYFNKLHEKDLLYLNEEGRVIARNRPRIPLWKFGFTIQFFWMTFLFFLGFFAIQFPLLRNSISDFLTNSMAYPFQTSLNFIVFFGPACVGFLYYCFLKFKGDTRPTFPEIYNEIANEEATFPED